MVEQNIHLDTVFGALSDPTRRSMLAALRSGEQTVGQLAEPFEMSLAGAAKHVQVLERSKLIKRRKEGRTYFCSINEEAFIAAQQWLQQYSEFWNAKLDTLTDLLEQEQENQDE
ncbi:MAG: metalloregulator ArsR/SmtB family transcription factor [Planctomycetota bacterium]